ncbi:MAG: hypothetical protein QN229_00270 [Desulfurococcaceae archaeon TW002]
MSKPKSSRFLPPLTDLITTLENISEARGAFYLNLFITCLVGYVINTWLGGLTSPEELRRYFSKLYEVLISGSYELDKEVIEIVAALGSDAINEATYDEIISKILMIFKDLS